MCKSRLNAKKGLPHPTQDPPPISATDAGELPMWSGCTLERLSCAGIPSACSVRILRAWMNQIHNWNFHAYSRGFIVDFKLFAFVFAGYQNDISESQEEFSDMLRLVTS